MNVSSIASIILKLDEGPTGSDGPLRDAGITPPSFGANERASTGAWEGESCCCGRTDLFVRAGLARHEPCEGDEQEHCDHDSHDGERWNQQGDRDDSQCPVQSAEEWVEEE